MALQNTLKALADPIRREILNLLKQGRLQEGAGKKRPGRRRCAAASGELVRSGCFHTWRPAGCRQSPREGKFIYYQLNTSVLEEVMLWLSQLKGE